MNDRGSFLRDHGLYALMGYVLSYGNDFDGKRRSISGVGEPKVAYIGMPCLHFKNREDSDHCIQCRKEARMKT